MNNAESGALDRTSVEPDPGGHPPFPRAGTENGRYARNYFEKILVHRFLPDGTKEVCPKIWAGSELTSWQQILDLYGGECSYRLIAMTGWGLCHAMTDRIYFPEPRFRQLLGVHGEA
ncbi:hypothetical protein [Polyangium sp. 6x1]|uniref:hypothetical protein n=1 Tax=Polyangium sp. 6x1 TaxID=3042689 RepID=UPI00248220EC|nr:hypothetical protein [Polyangium sp. 6x1]MDI1445935.1 hypothetical protein [Polyangium sp. 6x1]